jgi:hypothetical protein
MNLMFNYLTVNKNDLDQFIENENNSTPFTQAVKHFFSSILNKDNYCLHIVFPFYDDHFNECYLIAKSDDVENYLKTNQVKFGYESYPFEIFNRGLTLKIKENSHAN